MPSPEKRPAKTRKPQAGDEVLVGVRVPKSFHERIQRECRRRELSLKEMVIYALKLYFYTPVEDWDHGITTYFRSDQKEEADERQDWTVIWSKYLSKMPREKIEFIVKAMEWDLELLRKSGRKPLQQAPNKPSRPGGRS
jgi:hypothetical protein